MGKFLSAVANAVSSAANFVASIFASDRSHTLPEPLPPLELRIVSVSSATPAIGEVVTIRWDYQSPQLLAVQTLQLHSLTFEGRVVTKTIGCLPQALLRAGEGQRNCTPLDLNRREFQFEFRSPITFHLIAEDNDGRILQKYIKLTLPEMSLVVTVSAEQADYPRLGGAAVDGGRAIRCLHCFGIYENTPAEPSMVNHLENEDFRHSFSADAPFFLSSNSRLEAERFKPARGRAFPELLRDFLVRPQGQPLDGVERYADTVIIGVALAMDGTAELVPTEKGDCEIITSTVVKDLEPIFFQIDTRSTPRDAAHPVICNLHLGNIPQGLVFSTFHGDLSWQGSLTTGTSAATIEQVHNSVLRMAGGEVKDAKGGYVVVRVGETQRLPMRLTMSASWSNIPVFPDSDISELLATQYRLQ